MLCLHECLSSFWFVCEEKHVNHAFLFAPFKHKLNICTISTHEVLFGHHPKLVFIKKILGCVAIGTNKNILWGELGHSWKLLETRAKSWTGCGADSAVQHCRIYVLFCFFTQDFWAKLLSLLRKCGKQRFVVKLTLWNYARQGEII